MKIIVKASAWARPGCDCWVSPVSRAWICKGTKTLPLVSRAAIVAYAENAFANRRSVQPRNAGASSGPAT